MHRNQHNYDKMKLEIQKILLAFALPLLLLFILYTLRTMESVMNWDFITWGIYPKETNGDSHFSIDTRRLGTFICEHFPSSFFIMVSALLLS